MKFRILQENISEILKITSRFISNRVQLPILANILISAEGNKVTFSGTNLELSISISEGAQVDEPGNITIPSKTLTEIVLNLSKGPVLFESEKEQLKLSTENFESLLSGMNSSDFPKISQSVGENKMTLPEGLVNSLSQVLFSASSDETRPVLTGILMIFNEETMFLVSTDGFRLSRKKLYIGKTSKSEQKLILPKNALVELARLLDGGEVLNMSVDKDNNQVIFGLERKILTTRVIEGEFPDFEKIIPKTSAIKISLDKEELLRTVKLASVFARDASNVIKLTLNKDYIEILAESSQAGSQKGKVDAKIEGDFEKDFTIAFNYRFLEEYLNSVVGENVEIGLNDPNSPGVFADPKDKDFLHLIMPVRLGN